MSAVEGAHNPAMMGTDSFSREEEAVIGCWTAKCCVKVLELAGTELAIGAGCERMNLPRKSLRHAYLARY